MKSPNEFLLGFWLGLISIALVFGALILAVIEGQIMAKADATAVVKTVPTLTETLPSSHPLLPTP